MIRRLRGPAADEVREIDRDLLVGRTDADVEIPDPEVSRRHAVIRPVPEGVEVEDVGSSNGTFVDGERLTAKRTLSQSATLRVGGSELKIEVERPQVTQLRPAGIRPSDVTMKRPMAAWEVTAARPQPGPPASGPPEAPQPGPPASGRPEAPQPGPPASGPPKPPQPGPPASGPPKPPQPGPPASGPAEAPQPGPEPAAPALSPSAEPVAATSSGRRKIRRDVAFAAGGILLGALLAVVLILVLGGSSKKSTPRLASTVKPDCPAHLPAFIHDGFPEPKMIFSHSGVLDTSLTMSTADVTVNGTAYTTGFEYNQQLPAPTLFVCPGDRLSLHLHNQSPLPTNLHVHGMHVSPNGNGDNVFIDVPPLTEHTYQYQIPLDQSPGFYFYHPHFHPYVDPQEAGGALGGIVVEGSLDDRLPNIPERLIEISGGNIRFKGQALGTAASPAKKGAPPPIGVPELLVNGAADPVLRIRPGQLQRWRILNGTSDRLVDLELPGVTFYVLAQDGVTLRNMRPMKQLLIGPGSRVEVLVRGGPTGVHTLTALPFHPCQKGCNPLAVATTPAQSLITVVSDGPVANDRLPTGPTGTPPDLRTQHVDVRRTIVFSQQPAPPGKKPVFYLNDHTFNPDRTDITMKLGSVEEWTLTNPTNRASLEWHTFHIHQNPFQVISIDGKPLDYIDWQDNVTLAPGQTIKILINPIDFTGKFVFHCHVLFHEDNGMMATVQVVAHPSPAEVNANRVIYLVPPTGQAASAQAHDPGAKAYLLYCAKVLAAVDE